MSNQTLNNTFNTQNLTFKFPKGSYQWHLRNHYLFLATSVFKYTGLPKEIKSFHIEELLFNSGQCGITKTTIGEFMVGAIAGTGTFDLNNEPLIADVVSKNGKVIVSQVEHSVSGVFIKNNLLRHSTIGFIFPLMEKLNKIWLSDDTNLLMSNKKFLTEGKPQHFDSANKEAIDILDPSSPILYMDVDKKGYDRFIEDNINDKVLNFDVTYEPMKYNQHWKEIHQQVLTRIGVEHNSSSKRERNVTDEVVLSNVETGLMIENMLETRQEAIELINKLYNLSVTVEFRDQATSQKVTEETTPINKEEESDE